MNSIDMHCAHIDSNLRYWFCALSSAEQWFEDGLFGSLIRLHAKHAACGLPWLRICVRRELVSVYNPNTLNKAINYNCGSMF